MTRIEDRAAGMIAEEMTLRELRRTVEAIGGSLSLTARFPARRPVELSGVAGRGIDGWNQSCPTSGPKGTG